MTSQSHKQYAQDNRESQLEYTWKPLGFLNLYRLLISGFFTGVVFAGWHFPPLAAYDKSLFLVTSLVYFLLALLLMLLLHLRWPQFITQIYIHVGVDIIAIILLMHASGGVTSGLGTLLIIVIAGGSILVSGNRQALLFAAVASLGVLGQAIYGQVEGSIDANYTHAGILGLTLFITAIVAHAFSKRIRESEALAKKRGVDLENMAQLTEHIIQRMQTGIVVIDGEEQIRLMNESAWHMLGMPSTAGTPPLAKISSALTGILQKWKQEPGERPTSFAPSSDYPNVSPRFARLSQEERPGMLIFLEDASAMAQQAQQLQLASLGRLTASIAHEIRNPLGAISHAGQLLAESPNIDQHDQRLTRIIGDQSKRMNTIIENIMQLGRRDTSRPEMFKLHRFLEKFVHDFSAGQSNSENLIAVDIEPESVEVRFDITHLQQILTNLCENGLRHSEQYQGRPKIELRGGITPEHSRPFLDVIDHGPGIEPDTAAHIFEPFFTTSTAGTGLGLYISRELAECNQAHIKYIPLATGGSCFRINFQDPRRQMH